MKFDSSMRTIHFDDENEKARAFYKLVHFKAQFGGIGKDTFVISEDCKRLTSKQIRYMEVE